MRYEGPCRIADRGDEEELMKLCRTLWNENGIFTLDESKVRSMLGRAFDRQGGIAGVIGAPGHIEGVIYLLLSHFWYSSDDHWEELFLYVLPEFRRSNNAKELMGFAKWCSDESKFPLLIGVMSNEKTEQKVRLYKRQFNNPIGNFFLYNANGKASHVDA